MDSRKGFTLVELSIVLVIVGLLFGGVLVGQSLIAAAKIQAQIKQFQQFDIAATNFKTKYRGIPGDSPFGRWAGNGDKKLGVTGADTCVTTYLSGETLNFFPNLSAMGHLKDQYLPTWPTGGFPALNYGFGPGFQFPYSQYNPKKAVASVGIANGDVFYFLPLSTQFKPSPGGIYMSVLVDPLDSIKASDALAIDNKMDDGLPDTGMVVAVGSGTNHNSGAGCSLPYTLAPSNTDYPAPSYAATPSCVVAGSPRNYNMAAPKICQLQVKANIP